MPELIGKEFLADNFRETIAYCSTLGCFSDDLALTNDEILEVLDLIRSEIADAKNKQRDGDSQ